MYINEVTQKNKISSVANQEINRNNDVDVNQFLRINTDCSFIMRVRGDSMINAGITSGDMVIADKSIKPVSGNIVIAELNEKLTIKRLFDNGEKTLLLPENEKYESLEISESDSFIIWGVVTQNIKNV